MINDIDNDKTDLDFLILGRTVDEEDSDEDQSDLNEESVIESYVIELSKIIPYKISKYYWQFLIDSIPDDIKVSKEYWKTILSKMEKNYYLNTIQLFDNGILSNTQYDSPRDIVEFIAYIKLRLIFFIEQNKIDINISNDEFVEFLTNDKAPNMLIDIIKYLDRDSFKKFKNVIFTEAKKDYVLISF